MTDTAQEHKRTSILVVSYLSWISFLCTIYIWKTKI